ncbi:MAG: extracellular solute-binding protein [Caldicoprobacteraceae bacterium]|jgi:multiple sugar transport system substrate-binding protein
MKRKAKTMFKKLSALVLVILVLLGESACSGNVSSGNGEENKEFTPPSYTARDITEKLGIKYAEDVRIRMKMNSRGQLVIYEESDGANRYITVDGDGNVVDETRYDFKGDGNVFAFDENNSIYILVQEYVIEENRAKENIRRLVAYDANGQKQKSVDMGKIVRQKDENIFISSMSIDSKGNIYIVRNNEPLEVVDKDGKPVESPISGVYGFLDIDENGNVIAGRTNSDAVRPFIACIDPGSGKEIWKKQLDLDATIYTIYYNKAEKCIYALTDKGVDKYDVSGNLSGTVLDFIKHSLILEGTYIGNLCVEPSGSLYLSIYDSNERRYSIKKFEAGDGDASEQEDDAVAGEKATGEEEGEKKGDKKVLTLAAESSDRFLEMAVSKFQKEHPDIEISIKDYKGAYYGPNDTEEEVEKRREQFITTVNTELMAGKGPDIISFFSMPYKKYIDKNMLANLGELMDNDDEFNKDELNFNVIDAMRYKGGLYVMPISYGFYIMAANKELLDKENIRIDDRKWTWDDFMIIAEKITRDTNNDGAADQYAMYTTTSSGIFDNLFRYDAFIDLDKKKAYFATDGFINMLEACKAQIDKGILYKAGNDFEGFRDAVEMSKRGGIAFMCEYVTNFYFLEYAKSNLFPGEVALLRMPSYGAADADGIEFYAPEIIAISNSTRYRDEAWEFLKLLLSKDQQALFELNGFPVNNEALRENVEFYKNHMKVEQKDIDEINKFIPEVGRYSYYDPQLANLIDAEVDEFFSGNRSAEETAKIIQNKVELYLNE